MYKHVAHISVVILWNVVTKQENVLLRLTFLKACHLNAIFIKQNGKNGFILHEKKSIERKDKSELVFIQNNCVSERGFCCSNEISLRHKVTPSTGQVLTSESARARAKNPSSCIMKKKMTELDNKIKLLELKIITWYVKFFLLYWLIAHITISSGGIKWHQHSNIFYRFSCLVRHSFRSFIRCILILSGLYGYDLTHYHYQAVDKNNTEGHSPWAYVNYIN